MIDVLIFSKDRACQLDLLLRSIQRFLKVPCTVSTLYMASSEEFQKGYDLLAVDTPLTGHRFIRESNFRGDVLSFLSSCEHKMVMFLVDDNIFKAPFFEVDKVSEFFEDRSILCLSLRLGKNITYCYSLNADTPAPTITNGRWVWNSEGSRGDWKYPMSLDGHIFRKSDIEPIINSLDFNNPNYLEGYMSMRPLPQPLMMCFDESKVVNIPSNRVQDSFPNRHSNSSSSVDLNLGYQKGIRIDLEPLVGVRNISCHSDIRYSYKVADVGQ